MKKLIAVAATAAILLGAGQVLAANAKSLPKVAGATAAPTAEPSALPQFGDHKHRNHGKPHLVSGDIRTGDVRSHDIRGTFDFRSGDVRPPKPPKFKSSFDVRESSDVRSGDARGPHLPKPPHFGSQSEDARQSFDVRPPKPPKFGASFDARPSQDARPPFGAPARGHGPDGGKHRP